MMMCVMDVFDCVDVMFVCELFYCGVIDFVSVG